MRAESAMHDICKHLFGIGRKRLVYQGEQGENGERDQQEAEWQTQI